jgi:hypothetical protein
MLVYDDPQRVADWVGEQVGAVAPTVDAAIGYESGGELKAGVYFDCMTGSNIFCHIASTADVLPRELLRAVAVYAFNQAKLKRLTFPIPADNIPAAMFVRGMGAKLEAILDEAWGDHDLHMYVLWANDEFPQRLLTWSVDGEQ